MVVELDPQIIVALKSVVDAAVRDADVINKLWIAGCAVFVSLVSVLANLWIARKQRKTQQNLAESQRALSKEMAEVQRAQKENDLKMQALASKRTAAISVATKRQVWIDELRTDVAKHLAKCSATILHVKSLQELKHRLNGATNTPEQVMLEVSKRTELIAEFIELQVRIELRLNRVEDNHKALVDVLRDCLSGVLAYLDEPEQVGDEQLDVIDELRDNICSLTKQILKDEWERVKRESYVSPNMTDGFSQEY